MAERRMFARSIVESDAFYDLSMEEQTLYFHLSMSADDDGVIGSAKAITRSCGLKTDVLESLCSKRFLLKLRNGLYVIKHWRINNYVQKDRYKPTMYSEEISDVVLKENSSYTEANKVETDHVSNEPALVDTSETDSMYPDSVSKEPTSVDTQVRLGKVREGESESAQARAHAREDDVFEPPTVEEVEAYCKSEKLKVNPKRFVSYYQARKWSLPGGYQISSSDEWKALIISWNERDGPGGRSSGDDAPDETFIRALVKLHEEGREVMDG
ncbi:MAG: hypothetical protein J5744_09280 [Oscillospiraceae bacterium]|nr:hypothetical protein [Oscillospiraceae bacterium]